MRTDVHKINEQTRHQDLTEGLMMFAPGTSKYFYTGEWRTSTPVFHADLCRQCMLCVRILILTTAKAAGFVPVSVRFMQLR